MGLRVDSLGNLLPGNVLLCAIHQTQFKLFISQLIPHEGALGIFEYPSRKILFQIVSQWQLNIIGFFYSLEKIFLSLNSDDIFPLL